MTNRWIALTIIFVSFLQFTLNWFDVVPIFGSLIRDMHISLPQIGLIVGMFMAGYGIMHIPAGWIAEQFGMRLALLLGIVLEGVGAWITAEAPSYEILLIGRAICGVGGAIYIGSAIGITTVWFREKELVTATGIITGVAFTIGAVIGIYVWGDIVFSLGWRAAMLWGAATSGATFVLIYLLFPLPPGAVSDVAEGHHLSRESVRRVFGNTDLWLMGFGYLGGYGSYFTAAHLLSGYAQNQLTVSRADADLLGVIVLVAGIPGSFLGGWLSDKLFGVIPVFVGSCIVEGIAFFLIPHVGFVGLQICAGLIGVTVILAFVSWIAMPGLYRDKIHLSDVPTAVGLLLSIGAIGGVAVPSIFGVVADTWGFDYGWDFCGVLSVVTLGLCFFARRPQMSFDKGKALVGSNQN
jgi:predicted MFS family arabinose efflux permease